MRIFRQNLSQLELEVGQFRPVRGCVHVRVQFLELGLSLLQQTALERPLLASPHLRLVVGALVRMGFAHVTAQLLELGESLIADLAREAALDDRHALLEEVG